MDEAVIPCLQLMSRDPALSQEDRDAMESIRSHWCCCLGQDMDGEFAAVQEGTRMLVIPVCVLHPLFSPHDYVFRRSKLTHLSSLI